MSLINDMLKDLERRNARAGVSPITSDVRSAASPPAGSERRLVWLLFAVIIVALASYAATHWIQPVPPVARPAPQPTTKTPAPAPAATAVPSVPVPEEPGGWVPPPEPANPEPAPAATDVPVAQPAPPVAGEVTPQTREQNSVSQTIEAGAVESAEKKTVKANRQTESVQPARPSEVAVSAKPGQKSVASRGAKTTGPIPVKQLSPEQRSANLYRQSVTLIQQGRLSEAQTLLQKAIETSAANHDARQLLVGIMVDSKRNAEAITLLRDGLAVDPGQSGFSMALARLLIESGDSKPALAELERGLAAAGEDAEYHAFFAALLQREERHAEAMQHYLVALRSNPSMPSWLVGVGISMQAQNLNQDAAEAYQRALDSGQLSQELVHFAEQRLKQVRR